MPATTSAACCAASSARTSSAARCWPSPARITPHTQFEAEVYVLSKEEGGRHTPFFSGYRPQFYFRTTDVTGTANLLGDAEMCMPGDNVRVQVELISPIAMDANVRFAIREGGRTVGSGVVTKVSSRALMTNRRANAAESPFADGANGVRRTGGGSRRSDGSRGRGIRPLAGMRRAQGCSSIGRALVSKTSGWEFKSPRPCH